MCTGTRGFVLLCSFQSNMIVRLSSSKFITFNNNFFKTSEMILMKEEECIRKEMLREAETKEN